jgi:hypothetical protein
MEGGAGRVPTTVCAKRIWASGRQIVTETVESVAGAGGDSVGEVSQRGGRFAQEGPRGTVERHAGFGARPGSEDHGCGQKIRRFGTTIGSG